MLSADPLRLLLPALLAVAAAIAFDRATERRGLLPPCFAAAPWRRRAAAGVLAGALWLGVFLPLGAIGLDPVFDPAAISVPQLFLLHGMLLASLAAWYLLGFGPDTSHLPRQLGLGAGRLAPEVGLGLAAGAAAWLAVLATVLAAALVVAGVAGPEAVTRRPPPAVLWLAGLPAATRLALSLSAGIAEEAFFRGLLQPRLGIAASTALFVLAHSSYQEPFLLLGVTLLSLIYGGLTRWRRSIWAAVVAHALFDAVQLLVVIPAALEHLPPEVDPGAGAWVAGVVS